MFDQQIRDYYKKRLQVTRFGKGGFTDEFDNETEAIICDIVKSSIHNTSVDYQLKAMTTEDAIKFIFELKMEIEKERIIAEREYREPLRVKMLNLYTKIIGRIKNKYNEEIEDFLPGESISI